MALAAIFLIDRRRIDCGWSLVALDPLHGSAFGAFVGAAGVAVKPRGGESMKNQKPEIKSNNNSSRRILPPRIVFVIF